MVVVVVVVVVCVSGKVRAIGASLACRIKGEGRRAEQRPMHKTKKKRRHECYADDSTHKQVIFLVVFLIFFFTCHFFFLSPLSPSPTFQLTPFQEKFLRQSHL